ncbi:MAG: DUF4386 domain-containing protein [Kangiellaceae bacterium]|nr:DUF4386 domain-containing protein [Kangiellaceae bacterium]MCW8997986.1 DUF4386 domain-containing protein [Kangiellaceae bacterium]
MNNLQKMGGIAALSEALLYLAAFIFFGAVWDFPSNSSVEQKLLYLIENQVILHIAHFVLYILFGIILLVLVLAIHERLHKHANLLSKMAAAFGLIWVGLVIASGMIANIGLNEVIELAVLEPEQARPVWLSVNTIVEGLGGGNEIVGGLWVLLLSIAALKTNTLPNKLNYLGLTVGLAGVFTVYPAEILTEIFGVSQLLWFAWLGLVLLSSPQDKRFHQPDPNQQPNND